METIDTASLSRLRALTHSGAAKQIRVAARINRSELARDVGVTPSCILRWEEGEREPRGSAAIRYLEVLDRLLNGGRAA